MPEDKGLTRSQREEEILKFWKENKIFEKALEKKSPKGEFVFYDGPPFATGLPHHGSLLSSIVKDVVPRYKTMRGFHVRRRWGWDCHGLPIENMVEKELGIKNKKEIEEMGVAKFNRACRDSVLHYEKEWKRFVDRVGRFVDFDNSYKTMDNTFIESVWHALKQIYNKGLLYEGRKVLLYCPHCETPLAKAEIAMDNSYKDVTEESVYVKFKVKGQENTYLLAWTTTPWTLPGNVALAVGKDIRYGVFEEGGNKLIRASEEGELMGRDLVGMEYEPLYDSIPNNGKAFRVYAADFVTTEDGTGVVHTAVMYGEDDYQLGLREGLPMIPLLDQSAHFNDKAPEFIRGQYIKKAEKAIKEDLESRGLMFKREMHTHSYPHCHRCGTPLIYNALSSWFINIQKVKDRMIKHNEKINWIPEHLKHGRFLNILEGAPDWTISRNRYWASPLPIWKDKEGKAYVIDSLETLKKYTKKSGNEYFAMRHGQAANNIEKIHHRDPNNAEKLTEEGRKMVMKSAKEIKNIDIIIASPYERVRETVEIVCTESGFPLDKVIYDDRLREWGTSSIFDGKDKAEFTDYYDRGYLNDLRDTNGDGESFAQVVKRVGAFMYELESRYSGKKIMIVSHSGTTRAMDFLCAEETFDHGSRLGNILKPLNNAEVKEIPFVPLPHNENFELDLHRPYIDEVELVSPEGKPLKRIPEVLDGWVESGSMPFAERHFPFESEKEFKKSFPADFIAEYIAQTRTWFYYMHAMAVLLFDNISFKNVVTTGTILAADGSKMSKSKGNYTDPMEIFDRFGADSMRYYLMSSVIMQAEDIRFIDDEVRQVHNQLLNILWNTYKFYEIYASGEHAHDPHKSPHVLDKWILEKLRELTVEVTESMDSYDMLKATRPIKTFVTDFSTWYVRRSRDRFKEEGGDKAYALSTTRYVLLTLSKLIAPVMPFIADDIYRRVKTAHDPQSVHLAEWPEVKKPLLKIFGSDGKKLLGDMEETRRIVSLALEARSKANIKIRQPLSKLEVRSLKLGKEYADLIKDEVNVKEVSENKKLESGVYLDISITPELEEEGRVREIVRNIQEMRKEKNLKPADRMEFDVPTEESEFYLKHEKEITSATNTVFVEN